MLDFRKGSIVAYNISKWKTKKLTDLRIPVASFFKHNRSDWHPEREDAPDGLTTFHLMESYIIGRIDGVILCVTDIKMSGEGSGRFVNWILEPALKDSSGELMASCVWEGGDSINQIRVKDGKVEWVDIDI